MVVHDLEKTRRAIAAAVSYDQPKSTRYRRATSSRRCSPAISAPRARMQPHRAVRARSFLPDGRIADGSSGLPATLVVDLHAERHILIERSASAPRRVGRIERDWRPPGGKWSFSLATLGDEPSLMMRMIRRSAPESWRNSRNGGGCGWFGRICC